MDKEWSPEEAMQDLLGRHLDGDLAEACFDSLEGGRSRRPVFDKEKDRREGR